MIYLEERGRWRPAFPIHRTPAPPLPHPAQQEDHYKIWMYHHPRRRLPLYRSMPPIYNNMLPVSSNLLPISKNMPPLFNNTAPFSKIRPPFFQKKKKWGGAFLFQQHASTLQQYGLTLEHVYNSPIDSARSTSEPDSELTFEPNDPSDPRNWPEWRKWAIVIALMLIDFSVSWAASRYLPPAEKGMETTFRVPDQAGTPGLRFYVLGLAFGPIALAPLSEYFGPSPVYIISYRMFFLCLLGSALGKSLRGSWCCEFCRG
jgi:hypothetical protein